MTSILSEDQKIDTLYWPIKAGIGIFPADTKNKKISYTGWPKTDFRKIDFIAEVNNGSYDGGIAIRTGRTISGEYYVIAIDFDGIDAVLAWFDSWKRVLEIATQTRIEWHGDKWRLHMLLLTSKPVKNRKIKIEKSLLEVKCENQALFVSPSIHKEGNPYTALKNGEIAILNENQLLQLESRIDSLSDGYMSDVDKQAYIRLLEDPEYYTKLGVGQGRHNGPVILGTSYLYRYNGEWKDYTDEQRKAKLWEWNMNLAVSKPEKEFDDIWKWIIEKHRRTRDKQHEKLREERRREQSERKFDKSHTFNMYPEIIKKSLEGNSWTEIGKYPVKWIVADSKMNVIYKAHQYDYETSITDSGKEEQRQRVYKLSIDDIKIRCIPIKIIKHESQLNFLQNQNQTYTMTFIDTTGKKFTLTRKTIDQIMDYLKNDGYIMPGYSSAEALSAIIAAFREDGKLEIDSTIDTMGLYWIENKLVPVRLEEYTSAYDKLMSLPLEERRKIALDTIELIEVLVKNFKPGIIPIALKIDVVSPAGFALKQYTNDMVYIRALFTYGWPRTGKTTVSTLPSALYFPYMSALRKRPFTSINTEARFGYFMCQDTFPTCVNEMKALNGQDPKAITLIEMLKSAIETQESRSIMNKTLTHNTIFPALRQVNFSSNAPPPRDVAFIARLIIKNFTPNDSHSEEQKKAFHEFISCNAYKLRMLGNFAIGYLCQHPEVIFKAKIEEISWEESAKEIIAKFYELAGLARPGWLDSPIISDDDEDYETDEINNINGALRMVLLNHFNDIYNRYIKNLGNRVTDSYEHSTPVTTDLTLRERIDFCIDNDITPHFKKNRSGKLVIFHSILGELQKYGIDSDQISSLKQLAEILGMQYGTLSQNNKPVKCVHDDGLNNMYDFLAADIR
jgi:hypothetical protein